MDTLPDLETFDIFRTGDVIPDLDGIETVLLRSERVAAGLATRFPGNEVFVTHLATARRGLALLPDARVAFDSGDQSRLDAIAAELAGLFTAQGKADRLVEWGLFPR